jgi:hypothetical protein
MKDTLLKSDGCQLSTVNCQPLHISYFSTDHTYVRTIASTNHRVPLPECR